MLKVKRPTVQQKLNFITINIALEGGGEAQSFFHMGSFIIFVRDCMIKKYSIAKSLSKATSQIRKNCHMKVISTCEVSTEWSTEKFAPVNVLLHSRILESFD